MRKANDIALFDPAITQAALRSAFRKLDPRTLARNPVMFVTEVVAVLSTVIFVRELVLGSGGAGVVGQIAVWLWFTVYFANFAEAMAEGRGKARADALRATQAETPAKRYTSAALTATERVSSRSLRTGDVVLVEAGDLVPADGEVIGSSCRLSPRRASRPCSVSPSPKAGGWMPRTGASSMRSSTTSPSPSSALG